MTFNRLMDAQFKNNTLLARLNDAARHGYVEVYYIDCEGVVGVRIVNQRGGDAQIFPTGAKISNKLPANFIVECVAKLTAGDSITPFIDPEIVAGGVSITTPERSRLSKSSQSPVARKKLLVRATAVVRRRFL